MKTSQGTRKTNIVLNKLLRTQICIWQLSDFEEDKVKDRPGEGALVVDLEGFEGPIDMLLTLAREQKVDLLSISILELADQYLCYLRSTTVKTGGGG